MHSSVWGPFYWYILHSITFSFDKENEPNKEDFSTIIKKIGTILPCGVCRNHFRQQLNRSPITNANYKEITRWLYNRHHYINGFLRKRKKPSYKKAEEMYYNKFNKNKVIKFFHYFLISLRKDRIAPYRRILSLFATTWPQKDKRELIKTLLSQNEYKKATSVQLLRNWIKNRFYLHIVENVPYKEPEPEPEQPTQIEQSEQSETPRKVTFDTPRITENENNKMREELKRKQKRINGMKQQLRHTFHIPTRVHLIRKINNFTLRVRNLRAKLSA